MPPKRTSPVPVSTVSKPIEESHSKTATPNVESVRFRQMRRTIGILYRKIGDLEAKLTESNSSTRTDETSGQCSVPASVQYAVMDYKTDRPKYPGKTGMHPVTFLEDLEVYLRRLSSKEHVIDHVVACLEGEVRNWARVFRQRWNTLSDFNQDFLQTYWSETEQSVLRRRIISERWDSSITKSMLDHFLVFMGQAKMLTDPLPEGQLVNDLMRHFPKDIQYMWVLRKGNTIIEAAEFLRKFDSIESQFGTSTSETGSCVSAKEGKPKSHGREYAPPTKRRKDGREVNCLETDPKHLTLEENGVQDLN